MDFTLLGNIIFIFLLQNVCTDTWFILVGTKIRQILIHIQILHHSGEKNLLLLNHRHHIT